MLLNIATTCYYLRSDSAQGVVDNLHTGLNFAVPRIVRIIQPEKLWSSSFKLFLSTLSSSNCHSQNCQYWFIVIIRIVIVNKVIFSIFIISTVIISVLCISISIVNTSIFNITSLGWSSSSPVCLQPPIDSGGLDTTDGEKAATGAANIVGILIMMTVIMILMTIIFKTTRIMIHTLLQCP